MINFCFHITVDKIKIYPKCLFLVHGFLKTKFTKIKKLEITCNKEAA
jgi:hypothetical protein